MRTVRFTSGLFANHTRRNLLVGSARSAFGAALATPLVARAQSAPIEIGAILPKSGPFAHLGSAAANGARIAVEQAGGKVLNRPVDLLWLDEPNPQGAQQNMTRAIHEEKVVAVIGGQNSATALGMSAVSKTEQFPLIVTGGAAREITGERCHRYVFRDNATVPAYSRLMASLAAALGKRWYFLVGSYAFGLDCYKTKQGELNARGGTEVGFDETPVGTSDFSSRILKIRQAKPDVVILGLAGADLVAIIRQFAEFGLKGKIELVSVALGGPDLRAMGAEAITGLHGVLWHYANPVNPPDDARLSSTKSRRVSYRYRRACAANGSGSWTDRLRYLLHAPNPSQKVAQVGR